MAKRSKTAASTRYRAPTNGRSTNRKESERSSNEVPQESNYEKMAFHIERKTSRKMAFKKVHVSGRLDDGISDP